MRRVLWNRGESEAAIGLPKRCRVRGIFSVVIVVRPYSSRANGRFASGKGGEKGSRAFILNADSTNRRPL